MNELLMHEDTGKKFLIFLKLFLLCLVLLPTLFFLFIPGKSTPSDLSDLTWKQMPEFFVLNHLTQNGQEGLVTVRTKDGKPVFIPGNWEVQLSPHYVFAFAQQDVRIISNSTVKTLKLSDESVTIQDVQTNINESRLAVLQTNKTSTRLCLLSMEKLNETCQSLDINKPSQIQWDTLNQDLLYIKTADNLFYTYDVTQSAMQYIAEEDTEQRDKATSLFGNALPSPTYPVVVLTALFFKQDSSQTIHHVSTKTINAITLEDGEHVLLKEQGALNILEPKTGRIAHLISASFSDLSETLFSYQGKIISF